jgi:hypothetical protein
MRSPIHIFVLLAFVLALGASAPLHAEDHGPSSAGSSSEPSASGEESSGANINSGYTNLNTERNSQLAKLMGEREKLRESGKSTEENSKALQDLLGKDEEGKDKKMDDESLKKEMEKSLEESKKNLDKAEEAQKKAEDEEGKSEDPNATEANVANREQINNGKKSYAELEKALSNFNKYLQKQARKQTQEKKDEAKQLEENKELNEKIANTKVDVTNAADYAKAKKELEDLKAQAKKGSEEYKKIQALENQLKDSLMQKNPNDYFAVQREELKDQFDKVLKDLKFDPRNRESQAKLSELLDQKRELNEWASNEVRNNKKEEGFSFDKEIALEMDTLDSLGKVGEHYIKKAFLEDYGGDSPEAHQSFQQQEEELIEGANSIAQQEGPGSDILSREIAHIISPEDSGNFIMDDSGGSDNSGDSSSIFGSFSNWAGETYNSAKDYLSEVGSDIGKAITESDFYQSAKSAVEDTAKYVSEVAAKYAGDQATNVAAGPTSQYGPEPAVSTHTASQAKSSVAAGRGIANTSETNSSLSGSSGADSSGGSLSGGTGESNFDRIAKEGLSRKLPETEPATQEEGNGRQSNPGSPSTGGTGESGSQSRPAQVAANTGDVGNIRPADLETALGGATIRPAAQRSQFIPPPRDNVAAGQKPAVKNTGAQTDGEAPTRVSGAAAILGDVGGTTGTPTSSQTVQSGVGFSARKQQSGATANAAGGEPTTPPTAETPAFEPSNSTSYSGSNEVVKGAPSENKFKEWLGESPAKEEPNNQTLVMNPKEEPQILEIPPTGQGDTAADNVVASYGKALAQDLKEPEEGKSLLSQLTGQLTEKIKNFVVGSEATSPAAPLVASAGGADKTALAKEFEDMEAGKKAIDRTTSSVARGVIAKPKRGPDRRSVFGAQPGQFAIKAPSRVNNGI